MLWENYGNPTFLDQRMYLLNVVWENYGKLMFGISLKCYGKMMGSIAACPMILCLEFRALAPPDVQTNKGEHEPYLHLLYVGHSQ